MAVEQAEVDQAKVDELMGRLDDQARAAYRARLAELEAELNRDTISTGTSCAYAPAAPVDWEL